jgi:predicted ribosomally synthesized peptide with nif11-like leader
VSISEVERFAADLKNGSALQDEAKRHHIRPLAQVVAFATAQGYDFTAEEAKSHLKTAKENGSTLTDSQLDGAAGGVNLPLLTVWLSKWF